jgi:hypothetical protein
MMSTTTCKPFLVRVFSISFLTKATLVKITPWQARVTCGKRRCSIGLYLEQYSMFAQISEQIADAVWTLFAEAKTAGSHRPRHAAVR